MGTIINKLLISYLHEEALMAKQLIAVMGATGTQGGGVVSELLDRQRFAVRVLTRNPNSDKARALQA